MGFVEALCRHMQNAIYVPGQYIFKQGDQGENMYIILRGKVEISVLLMQVATLEEGKVFGEVALLGVETRRSASARALSLTRCCTLHRKVLVSYLEQYPLEFANMK